MSATAVELLASVDSSYGALSTHGQHPLLLLIASFAVAAAAAAGTS